MKRLLFLFFITSLLAVKAKAQDAPWKTSLVQQVVQKFSLSTDDARRIVNIKESYFKQVEAYRMPHIESKMSKAEVAKAVEDLKQKEFLNMTNVLRNEPKAKEVAIFLEGRIPQQTSQPRRR